MIKHSFKIVLFSLLTLPVLHAKDIKWEDSPEAAGPNLVILQTDLPLERLPRLSDLYNLHCLIPAFFNTYTMVYSHLVNSDAQPFAEYYFLHTGNKFNEKG